jgi:hypothetical protein
VRRRSAELFAIPRDEVEGVIDWRQVERSRLLLPPERDDKRPSRSRDRSVEQSGERLGARSSSLDRSTREPAGDKA